ncbi:Snapin/Pallidin/Snn1, partial [Dillenia turbinata]
MSDSEREKVQERSWADEDSAVDGDGGGEPSSSASASSSCDALGQAISATLATVIRDFDCKAEDALNSQIHLSSAITRLTAELDQLLEDAPLPFIMQHAARISGVRKRVSSLNTLLNSIQRRVDNIDRILSTGLPH